MPQKLAHAIRIAREEQLAAQRWRDVADEQPESGQEIEARYCRENYGFGAAKGKAILTSRENWLCIDRHGARCGFVFWRPTSDKPKAGE